MQHRVYHKDFCRGHPSTTIQCSAAQCTVPCSAVQCSAAQRNTAHCSAVQCRAVQRSAVPCRTAQHSAAQCRAVPCRAAQCSAVQCSAVPCSAAQCRAVPCCAVQFSAVQRSAVQCSSVQCSAVQCSAMQRSAVPCCAVQFSAVQCSAVQCGAAQCSAVPCSAAQCSAVQCSAAQCRAVQRSAVQCSAVPCSAVQCSAVQCSAVWVFCDHRRPLVPQVWKVRYDGKFYAMKAIRKEFFERKNMFGLLKSERALLATIRHPFITRLRYAFQTPRRAFLVMDYINGGELGRHLKKDPRRFWDEDRVRLYTAQLVLAFEYLHGLGVLYRDLKIDNVMFDADGHAVLIDLGLAKKMAGAKEEGSRQYFGVPNMYFSPEMLRGEDFGFESDWWALGVLVYGMLMGSVPFPAQGKCAAKSHELYPHCPLHCAAVHFTALHCTVLYCTVLGCVRHVYFTNTSALRCTTDYCTARHDAALHHTAQPCVHHV